MQVLPSELARIHPAFESLSMATDPNFRRVVEGGKLRYTGKDGKPDLVDRLTARLACTAIQANRSDQVLAVFPDDEPRRCPLLFATALITDALAHLDGGAVGHRVLYVSGDAGIRKQLKCVQLGTLTLDGVFDLQYGRGRAERLQSVSVGALRLPSVLCIQAPAEPSALIRQYRPKWIAVDCGDGSELPWLPALLGEARRSSIPVVGWAPMPLGSPVHQWIGGGGGVFRWPRRGCASPASVDNLEQLAGEALTAEVTAYLLEGENVVECSRAFATAAEALLAAAQMQAGRLSADAVSIGWRYLRAMEALPVPFDVYEREASSYWGVRRIGELHDAFDRFTAAVDDPLLRAALQEALDALASARDRLAGDDPPLWLGLATLCIDSQGPREIIFSTRARLRMFSLSLLALFNVSEDDLREIGVCLRHLSSQPEFDGASAGGPLDGNPSRRRAAPLLVGLPGRSSDRHLEAFLQSDRPEILIWPHQDEVLQCRLRSLSGELSLTSRGLRTLLPSLEGVGSDGSVGRRQLCVAGPRCTAVCRPREQPPGGTDVGPLWRRPDAAQAIASLFGPGSAAEEDEERSASPLLDEAAAETTSADGDDAWVQSAVEIRVEGGRRVLLPVDERVNVIVRGQKGAAVEQRYVRSLAKGDEILFIQGQRRQSLYELLVSRVHRDPVIAQYLALVRRWQDDFGRAFADAERLGRTSADQLLAELQVRGSAIRTSSTIRAWVRGQVLAPSDADDIRRIADVFSLAFVHQYYAQIHRARGRLWGLHIQLSAKLNRWLDSDEVGTVADGDPANEIDSELGLTVEDFRHSLLRLQVVSMTPKEGPFYRPHLGHLDEGRS